MKKNNGPAGVPGEKPICIPVAEARSKPPERPESGSGEAHGQRLQQLFARMTKGLMEAKLSETERRKYRRATRAVIARMSPAAVQRLHANTEEFKYYPNFDVLAQAIKRKYPALAKKLKPTSVIKGMLGRDGTVHLDGGGTLRGRSASIADFYAHELTHGIDGTDHELSDSVEWRKVWAEEILGNTDFTKKAQEDLREAFSEVGSLLLGGGISANELALLCPGVVDFWRKRHKLLAGG